MLTSGGSGGVASPHRPEDHPRGVHHHRQVKEGEYPHRGLRRPVPQDDQVRDDEHGKPEEQSGPRRRPEHSGEEEGRNAVERGEPRGPEDPCTHPIEQRDRPHPPGLVVFHVDEVVCAEVGEGVGVEEEEVEESGEVGHPRGKVARDREEGEVGPPDDLGDGDSLVPLLHLIKNFDGVTVSHDRGHEEGVRVGERGDEAERYEGEDEEEGEGVLRGDLSFGKGPCPEEPPVPGQPPFDVFCVALAVHVVVEHHPGLEAEEADEGGGEDQGPGEVLVRGEGEEEAGAEEERPGEGELDAQEVGVGAEGHGGFLRWGSRVTDVFWRWVFIGLRVK